MARRPRPRIEEYLDGLEGPERSATWLELVMVDQALRRERGNRRRWTSTCASCPGEEVWLPLSTDAMAAALAAPAAGPTADWGRRRRGPGDAARRPDDPEMPTLVRHTVQDDPGLPGLDGPFGDYELLDAPRHWRHGRGVQGAAGAAQPPGGPEDDQERHPGRGEEPPAVPAESEAVAALDHPHIVPVLERGEHRGISYYTMKLVEGDDLGRCLHTFRDRPREIARLMARAAEAIAHATSAGCCTATSSRRTS